MVETVNSSTAFVTVSSGGEAMLVEELRNRSTLKLPWSVLKDVELVAASASGERGCVGPSDGAGITNQV